MNHKLSLYMWALFIIMAIISTSSYAIGCKDIEMKKEIVICNSPIVEQKTSIPSAENCGVVAPKQPKDGCEHRFICAKISDQSVIQVVREVCSDSSTTDTNIYFYQSIQSNPILVDTLKDQPIDTKTEIEILDSDGSAQLDFTYNCGTSACGHDLYRFKAKNKSLYLYFSGSYLDLLYFDGYLLEGSHMGCCEQEYRAHRLRTSNLREKVDDDFFVIAITAPQEKSDVSICSFFKYIDDGNKVYAIKAPNKKWLQFCERYRW